ncbi:MAG TPA: CpaD family pilus assembly lipoprotein [Alphaproteobacteria bacterium]|nr:CpaD family pilus assembly lipoprotein [Alphaproteobacteria bacterium]
MKKLFTSAALLGVLLLSGCGTADQARPDYRIGVLHDNETGRAVALAKPCPTWHQHIGEGLENHFEPQFGCADAYNLAHEIERPTDLISGRRPADAEAAPGVLGIERYREDKTKQLINPKENSATTKD